jgi:hypothetical protein
MDKGETVDLAKSLRHELEDFVIKSQPRKEILVQLNIKLRDCRVELGGLVDGLKRSYGFSEDANRSILHKTIHTLIKLVKQSEGNYALLLFRGICSTMKSWSIFHVYSTVTDATDVMHWILALPMRDIRATDVTHWKS